MVSEGSWVSLMVGLLCRDPKRGCSQESHAGLSDGYARLGQQSTPTDVDFATFTPWSKSLICSWAWLHPRDSHPWEHQREKPPVIQKVGDGWGTVRKSFRILQHWYYREKEDKRADKHGQGRRQLPPASPICFPQSCLCFPTGYRGFFEGRQRALRGQREKRGVSEESEHSCEKCHSYLGNWKYFPSLPEWSFPDFNYIPIVSEKDTWLLTSFGPEEIRLSTF